jgi:hypothetical protein
MKRGSNRPRGLVTGGRNGWGREMTVGSHMAAREREGVGYRFGNLIDGPRAHSGRGPIQIPGVLFHFYFVFSFFFFCSLISLITFANLVQIASNQFVKFPRIQHSNMEL